jgi:hypothetical protein
MAIASPFEFALLALINNEREAAGLEPLTLNTLLNDAAEAHSRWMLAENQFSHEGEDGSTPGDRMEDAGYPFEGQSLSAENIGWQSLRGDDGFEDDVAQVHESLMNSPGHRANILNPDAEDVGLGVEVGTFTGPTGEYQAVMVTQVFAATDADVSAWTDPGTGEPEEDPVDEAPTETDPPIIAEETPEPETPVTDQNDPIMVDFPIDEEVTMDSDAPSSDPAPEVFPPCGVTNFTVDLSEAFEVRQDGDQMIWETSEEQLFDAFMKSFDTWVTDMDPPDGMTDDVDQSEDLLADLMIDDQTDLMMTLKEDEADQLNDWLLSDCA